MLYDWIAYTDGACFNNGQRQAKGGWGLFFRNNDYRNEIGWVAGPQTNQRNELAPILRLMQLAFQEQKDSVLVYSDSKYAKFVVHDDLGIYSWKRNGWLKTSGKDVSNQDILRPLANLMRQVDLTVEYVQGHSGIHGNEKADKMAKYAATIYHEGVHTNPRTGYPYRSWQPLHSYESASGIF